MVYLQKEQVVKWENDGYFKIDQFFADNIVTKISECVNTIAVWPDVKNKWMKWYEQIPGNSKSVCRIENFLDYHDELNDILLKDGKIKNIIEELIGEKIFLYKEKIIIKAPHGGGYVPHQDIYDLVSRQVHEIVMIAIDSATEANGCVNYSKNKEHKKGIISRDKNGKILPEIYKQYEWEAVECRPGDVVVFDNYVPHYSEPNSTSATRRALFLAYHKASVKGFTREEYYKNKRIINPPEPPSTNVNSLNPSCTIMYEKNKDKK